MSTLSTQLLRYATHKASAGGGRATSIASRRKFWAMAARSYPMKLSVTVRTWTHILALELCDLDVTCGKCDPRAPRKMERKKNDFLCIFKMVGEEGLEPSKS